MSVERIKELSSQLSEIHKEQNKIFEETFPKFLKHFKHSGNFLDGVYICVRCPYCGDVFGSLQMERIEIAEKSGDFDSLIYRHYGCKNTQFSLPVGAGSAKYKPAKKIRKESKDVAPAVKPVDKSYIYIQKLSSPFYTCLKVGISKNVKSRMKSQARNSMFKHKILDSFAGDTKVITRLEARIKREFERSLCMKEWLPDGYTETFNLEDYDSIKDMINLELS